MAPRSSGSGPSGRRPPPTSGRTPDLSGLTAAEARRRLEEVGPNELPQKRREPLLTFLAYFWGPIPWMIEVAAVLSGALRDWTDLAIILVLLVANAGVGFWEEFQAGNAIAALQKTLALHARVRRDGAWATIPARELGPGDEIEVDQSALTGESLPVVKGPAERVFSGSIVRRGEIEAEVEATGARTYFGKTAALVQETPPTSHFQRAVLKIGDYLIVLALGLLVLILLVALFRAEPMWDALRFALVLTVAAIPVAMPTVLSVTMAVGARLLAKERAIVRRLAATEEMAGLDVLCSDKTGTLTQNRLTLGTPFPLAPAKEGDVLLAAALASRAEDQDPIDGAVLGGVDAALRRGYREQAFLPFDPVHKRTEATVVGPDGATLRVTKGAPQVVLALAPDADRVRAPYEEAVNEFASRGFRSLGVARRDGDGPWRVLGVVPLYDPPREDSKETLEAASRLGIRVKMVTGDQRAIAKEIGSELGLGPNVLDASLFEQTSRVGAGRLAEEIEKADGFAQVYPEHKYHIVEVLQQRGHIVGMTGDGVNDAPALKRADAGIAVAGATDAARAAADIVLLAPGLSVIVDAVRESRRIFQRMTSYAVYRIAETIRVLLFMTLAILVFDFYPVTAVMIVLLALLNDGAILSIAYDRARPSDRPEAWEMPVVLGVATALGVAGVLATFGLFYLGEHVLRFDRATVQTLMYLKLSVAGHLTIFVTRTRGPFWSLRPAKVLFWAVVGTQAVATTLAATGTLMAPLGWKWAFFVWGYSLLWFLVNDRVKLAALELFDPHRAALPGARTSARALSR